MLAPSDHTKTALVEISMALNRLHKRFCNKLPRPRAYSSRRKTKDEIENNREIKSSAAYKTFNKRIADLKQKSQELSAYAAIEDLTATIDHYLAFIEALRQSLDGDEFDAADAVVLDLRQLKSIIRISYSHPHDARRRAECLPKKGSM